MPGMLHWEASTSFEDRAGLQAADRQTTRWVAEHVISQAAAPELVRVALIVQRGL